MIVKSVDARSIDDTLKEAVVDTLLNGLCARVSGMGEFSRTILGTRPSRLLMSGFLVPRPPEERASDEEADPMQISAHGLDFQIDKSARMQRLQLQLQGSVYVRVLPREEEVQPGSPCQPSFPRRQEVTERLNLRLNEEFEALRTALGVDRRGQRRHPDWAASAAAIRQRVHQELGIVAQPPREVVAQEPDDTEGDQETNATATEPLVNADVEPDPPDNNPVQGVLRDDVYDEVPVPEKWLRLDLVFPEMWFSVQTSTVDAERETTVVNDAIAAQIHAWYESDDPAVSGRLWGYRRRCKVLPSDMGDWAGFLNRNRARDTRPVVPKFDLRWSIAAAEDPLHHDRLTIHVGIENWTELPALETRKEIECSIFQTSVSVSLPTGALRPLTLDRVKPSYRYNKYLQYPALGFNGGVTRTALDAGDRLSTTWTPRYVLPRIDPSDIGVERRFAELSKPAGLAALLPLVEGYTAWLKDAQNTPVDLGLQEPRNAEELQNERVKLDLDVRAWARELKSLEVGTSLLTESAKHWGGPGPQKDPRGIPCEAWFAMNAAMRQVGDGKYDSWRLFQLAFIVSMVPTFASRIPEFVQYYKDDVAEQANAVTLLYFATGGGKSEAFLGLLLFVLFVDRLRGKHHGISALMRYPLRLLTLQQAKRTMFVLAAGESERSARGHPGEPFSLGFWVGGANTPNWHSADGFSEIPMLPGTPLSDEPAIKDNGPYANYRKQWLKLERCPFCNSDMPMALRRAAPERGGLLGHYCTAPNEQCSWNARHTSPTPIPFYIVDEDIYACAPSVLLGTVDKLAVIGQSFRTIRLVFGMFGCAPFLEQHTGRLHTPMRLDDWNGAATSDRYQPLYPVHANGTRRFFDPFPALLIQDEAHLLEESLGTFAGLFESALDAALDQLAVPLGDQICREPGTNRRRRVKVIAASATVSEPQRQMRNLYQREDTQQFPHPGPDLYTSFYARPRLPNAALPENAHRLVLEDPEIKSHGARVYAAILTNGHRHTVAMASILGNFHLQITELYEELRSGDAERQAAARALMIRSVSQGPLHALFEGAIIRATPSELVSLIDLHRIALTYVTNKKGGDQVIDTERVQFEALHRARGYTSETLLTKLISGAVSASDIQAVVRAAETHVRPGEEFPDLSGTLRSIIATSAVSHGVDVEEFNAMFFAGVPSDIAEYIQASSRVGRTHVGFSLLVPVPQRNRDRFVTEIFDIFHRFLERMVLPAAVDRWAEKAIHRVIPSVMQEYLCGVSRILELCSEPESRKANVRSLQRTNDVREYLQDAQRREGLARFVVDALGLDIRPPPEGEAYYRALVRQELGHYRQRMDEPRLQTTEFRRFFDQIDSSLRPMTSLRDVDQPGVIHAGTYDVAWRKAKKGHAAAVMEFIRRGVGTELDEDGDTAD